jgi:hypothetical protein
LGNAVTGEHRKPRNYNSRKTAHFSAVSFKIPQGIMRQETLFFKKSFSFEQESLSLGAMTLSSRLVISTPNITAFYMYENSHPAFHILKISFSPLHFYLITVPLVPYLLFPFPPRFVCRCSLS